MNPVKKLKKILTDLVKQNSTPEEIALGAAVGIFIGFSPWYGIQIYIALVCAYLIRRANKVAVVAGAQINWLAPLYYPFEYKLGLVLLRKQGLTLTIETFRSLTWRKILNSINLDTAADILWPLFIGSLVFGAIGSVITYFIAVRLVVRARARTATNFS